MSALTRTKNSNTRRVKTYNKVSPAKVTPLVQPSVSDMLKTLIKFERASLVIMLSLVGAVLSLYASAVYTPKTWSKEYRKLERLQAEERNLINKNEMLKNHLAQLAQSPASGMANVQPYQSIFLPAVNTNVSSGSIKEPQTNDKTKQDFKAPISY